MSKDRHSGEVHPLAAGHLTDERWEVDGILDLARHHLLDAHWTCSLSEPRGQKGCRTQQALVVVAIYVGVWVHWPIECLHSKITVYKLKPHRGGVYNYLGRYLYVEAE